MSACTLVNYEQTVSWLLMVRRMRRVRTCTLAHYEQTVRFGQERDEWRVRPCRLLVLLDEALGLRHLVGHLLQMRRRLRAMPCLPSVFFLSST